MQTPNQSNDDTIIQLKLTKNDIRELEAELQLHGTSTLLTEYEGEPLAFNNDISKPTTIPVEEQSNTENNPFENILKIKNKMENKKTTLNTCKDSAKPAPSRKNMIINNGMQKTIKPVLPVYNNGWPSHSPYACWLCCHTFNNTSVGIPERLVDGVFYLSGNFCSFNCAKRYLKGDTTADSVASMQTHQDLSINDDKANRLQLLELLFHLETGVLITDELKMSPPRLSLALFGGWLSIDEFRKNFNQPSEYHVYKSPLVPIVYQLEETIDIMNQIRPRANEGVEKKYNALLSLQQKKNNFVLEKTIMT